MNPSGDGSDAGFHRVADLTAAGDPAAARAVLRRLASEAGPDVAGRALRLSATLDRVLGDPDSAVSAAARAVELAGSDDDLAAAAYAELGESLMAAGRPSDAAAAYATAADRATTSRNALRRMQAFALAAAGQPADSTAILRDLAQDAGDPQLRASLLVQAAGNLPGGKEAAQLWREAHDAVDAAGVLRADLAFVAAATALDAGDLHAALAGIRAARRHALAEVAVLQYLAAAIAESAVAELLGDDKAAYASLATGYATLGDVVGKALSGSTFDGPLRALRGRWGAGRFARAKRAYDDERRARIA